jgi:hypothetical protein
MGLSEFIYLRDVLGLKDIPLPSSLKNEVEKFEVRPVFCVFSPFPFSEVELSFAKKMFSAVQIPDVFFFNQKENTTEEIALFTQKHTHTFGVSFGTARPLSVHAEWFELPSISKFLDNSDPKKLQELKRTAWENLKSLKSQMEKL